MLWGCELPSFSPTFSSLSCLSVLSDPRKLPSIALPFSPHCSHLGQTQSLVQSRISSTSFPIFTFKWWSQVCVTEKIKTTKREPPAVSLAPLPTPCLCSPTLYLRLLWANPCTHSTSRLLEGIVLEILLSIYWAIPIREKKFVVFILLNSLAGAP